MFSPKKISFILSLFILLSCYDRLDFEQAEAYVFDPVYTSALTFFTFVPAQFFDSSGTIQINTISETTGFKGFKNNDLLRDNLFKIVFNAKLLNEFNRDVTIQVEFLDEINNIIYSFEPIIVDKSTLTPQPFEEEIIIALHPDVLDIDKIKITAHLEDTGIPVNLNDTSEFKLESSITLFIQSSI